MGVFGDGDNKAKGKKRGSVNNTNRLAGLGGAGKAGTRVDWGDASPDSVAALVVAVTRLGGLVSFGLSRDRGSASVTILLDGEKASLWFNGDADLDVELEKTTAYVTSLPD